MSINKQPPYPGSVAKPRAFLKTQVTPRNITTETPVLLYNGATNNYGAVITSIILNHVGDNISTVVRFYSKLASSTAYDLMLEHTTSLVTSSDDLTAIPIEEVTLPAMHPGNGWPDNRGFRVGAGESIYVALGTAVANGLTVFAEVQEY